MVYRLYHNYRWLLTKEQANWVKSSIRTIKTYPTIYQFIEQLNDEDRSILCSFSVTSVRQMLVLKARDFEVTSKITSALGLNRWMGGTLSNVGAFARGRNPRKQSFSLKLLTIPRDLLGDTIGFHLTQMIALATITNNTWNKITFDDFIFQSDRRMDRACVNAYFSYFEVRKVKLFTQRFFSLAIAIQRGLTTHFVPFTAFFKSRKGLPPRKTAGKQTKSSLPSIVGYDEYGIPIFSGESGPGSYGDEIYVPSSSEEEGYYFSDQDSYSW